MGLCGWDPQMRVPRANRKRFDCATLAQTTQSNKKSRTYCFAPTGIAIVEGYGEAHLSRDAKRGAAPKPTRQDTES